MVSEFLSRLACPQCLAPLKVEGAPPPGSPNPVLVCQPGGHRFPVSAGVPQLVRPGREASADAFETAYADVWRREGWGSADPDYLLALPWKDVTRRQSGKWRVKARSLEALRSFLEAVNPHVVADLGAGVGWLARHLAEDGYTVYAVDVMMDEALGLGAAGTYLEDGAPLLRVRGEMERPPLRDHTMDVVISNASLHYASDLERVLNEVGRVLAPEGYFVIMNSPVHSDAGSAGRAQRDFRSHLDGLGAPHAVTTRYRHFVRKELVDALERLLGPVQEVEFDPGLAFRLVRVAKGVILRMEVASFPILVSRKAEEGHPASG